MAKDAPEVVRPVRGDRKDRPGPPVKPTGPITFSVGAGGINQPDDMRAVKKLLNGIPAERGGAFDSLDPDDFSTTGPEFSRFVEAIHIFQRQHLSQFFKDDGRVEPNKRTINKLLDEARKAVPKPPSKKGVLLIQPAEQQKGFNNEGMRKVAGDWQQEFGGPLCQMVPAGGSRTLLLQTSSPDLIVSKQIEQTDVAVLADSNDNLAIINGRQVSDPRAEALLTIRLKGEQPDQQVRVIVRRRVTVTVHFHTLSDPIHRKGVSVLGSVNGRAMVDGLNKIYEPQTNVVFALGKERNLTTINSREIDFDRTLVVDNQDVRTPAFDQQLFQGKEFDASCVNVDRDVNVFLAADILFFKDGVVNPNVIGQAYEKRDRRCWINSSRFAVAGNRFVLFAHEIGHALGLTHIKFMRKALMFPELGANNVFIPPETLEELIVS